MAALSLFQSDIHPILTWSHCRSTATESIIKVAGTRYKDSGGGFLIEESTASQQPKQDDEPAKIIHTEATHPIQTYECQDCKEEFLDSYLQTNFNYLVCDKCRWVVKS